MKTELEKLKEIIDQLSDSIRWLKREASLQRDWGKKSQLQKEATAAEMLMDKYSKTLKKNEHNN